MAELFGVNRLKDLVAGWSSADFESELDIVRSWLRDYRTGSLIRDNETAREQSYNNDFFKTILGYVEKPTHPFTLEPKSSTATGQIPDARLGYFDPANGVEETTAVVELKGAAVDLDRPQRGHSNLSPVQQGFKYRPQYRGCTFVIVSNFFEIRLYNDNQLDYQSWTLESLIDEKDDFLQFKTFFLLLHSDRLPRRNGVSKTEAYLSDIRITQAKIGKEFYDDYDAARTALLKNLYNRNKAVRDDLELGIEKAQKVLDRVVFACFAEDGGLLPDGTLKRIQAGAQGTGLSRWSILKALFEGIDRGDEGLGIPVGYNGGLFAKDEALDALGIDDTTIDRLLELGVYNFVDDLSVNVLGNLFEQSINDLAEIRAQIGGSSDIHAFESRRRRNDGIFYTPEYIVRHIVDHTLGAFLRETEQRVLEEFQLHSDILDSTYQRREQDAYLAYRELLNAVTVVDPAAGSGAFLTGALDLLQAEHNRVSSILGNDLFSAVELTGQILRTNLYGVDINEESVEITKLSLWLKSATKGNKLQGLDRNVRVGNSLKPQAQADGDKAFDWFAEFPEVMNSGGFDVVIGNPPYIKEYTHKDAFEGLYSNPVYQGKMDIWYMFGDLALRIVKKDVGRIGFIAPSNWITNSGASKFRDRVVKDAKILEYWDFGNYFVFSQAGIQTMIYIMTRATVNDAYAFPYARVNDSKLTSAEVVRFLQGAEDLRFTRFEGAVRKADSLGTSLNINRKTVDDLLDHIKGTATTQLASDEVATGIDVHQDYLNKKGAEILGEASVVGSGIFNLSHREYTNLRLNAAERALVRPFYTTEQLGRYFGNDKHDAWVIYTDSSYKDAAAMSGLPNLRAHLDSFADVITSDNKPYGLHRARDERFFKGEKIISLRKAARPTFTYTDFDAYVSQTFFVVKTTRWEAKALTALLNSDLIAFWLRYKGKIQGDAYQVDKGPLLSIPLLFPARSAELADLADANIRLRSERAAATRHFQASISVEAPGWTGEHPSWWDLTQEELLASLPSSLPLSRRPEVVDVFEAYQATAIRLSNEIRDAEDHADALVFEAYGLDEEQIQLVKTSI